MLKTLIFVPNNKDANTLRLNCLKIRLGLLKVGEVPLKLGLESLGATMCTIGIFKIII